MKRADTGNGSFFLFKSIHLVCSFVLDAWKSRSKVDILMKALQLVCIAAFFILQHNFIAGYSSSSSTVESSFWLGVVSCPFRYLSIVTRMVV